MKNLFKITNKKCVRYCTYGGQDLRVAGSRKASAPKPWSLGPLTTPTCWWVGGGRGTGDGGRGCMPGVFGAQASPYWSQRPRADDSRNMPFAFRVASLGGGSWFGDAADSGRLAHVASITGRLHDLFQYYHVWFLGHMFQNKLVVALLGAVKMGPRRIHCFVGSPGGAKGDTVIFLISQRKTSIASFFNESFAQ